MADTFRPQANGLFFDVINERTGEVVVELVDCIGDARWYCQDLAAADAEAEAATAAEQQADYMAQQREMDIIYCTVSRMYDADKPATDPRNFAVREILGAIDSLGRSDVEQREAA